MQSPNMYFDYAATTPVDPRVAEKMWGYLTSTGVFGNPSSLHAYGVAARNAVEEARAQVAALIHADPSEIIWTSGATEADNLAIKGAAELHQRKGRHIVTLQTEHKAVLDSCHYLEKNGYQVTYLQPGENGVLDIDVFKAALREDTILASIMHVNNETGVMQNLAAIANETSRRGILLHVDAAQSGGKTSIDVSQIPIDLLSLSAHKMYGPKGMGALYLRKKPRVRVMPLIHGGGHEQGMRSGTLPTHQIVGMGEACQLALTCMREDNQRIDEFRQQLLSGLSQIRNLRFNGDLAKSVPHIVNLSFVGMLGAAILADLPYIAASTGSACQAQGGDASYVLRAMGLSSEEAQGAIRFSFGRFTTGDEVNILVEAMQKLFGIGDGSRGI